MPDTTPDPRKYIIGWLTCRPGKRDELIPLIRPYVAACLSEEGCVFFEMNPSIHDPDVVTVAECYASREAHEAHLKRETFLRLWGRLHDLCLEGRFLNIFPHHVEPDTADFRTRPGG